VFDDVMRARVTEARVARLATLTSDGAPHLVPCCFALDGDVVYSAVDGKPKSTLALRRLANLRADSRASLLVDFYGDDWSTLWWVRLDGSGRVIDAGEERDAALALLAAKYDQYRTCQPVGPVVAIDVATWRGWP
jgi:PPOX class probable F420-dependent enzyme